jgi:type I restriction enzyme S subunit
MSDGNGGLPPGWALTELGTLSERCGGGTPSRSVKRYFQGKIPWLTVTDLPPIGTAPPTIVASRENITDEAIAVSSAKPIPKDSVVFATRVSVGKVAIAGCTLATNQDFRSLLPGPAHEPSYIAWFLSYIAQFNLPSNQGTTIKRITASKFDGIRVPLPPLTEQQRIAAKIEALRERSRRAREALSEVGPLLEQFRQSVLVAAFQGDLTTDWRAAHPNVEPASELLCRIRAERRHRWEQTALAKYEAKGQKPPKNWQDKYEEPEPVDDSYLPALLEGWCWAGLDELKDLSPNSMTDGPFGSKLKTSHYSSSGIRVVRLGNIGVGHFNASDEAFIPEVHYEELRKHEIFAGDLVIAALAEPVARCCKIPPSIDKAIVKADCIRFRPHPSVLSEIVMHWLNSGTGRRLAEIASHGIGRLRINMENLRSLPVALPPVDEQIEIVARITRQLAGIARIEEQVSSYNEDLDQLDQSILAKAFRGELVRQDPNDESAAALLARIREQKTQQTEAAKHKQKTSMPQRGNKMSEESSRLTPQQLTLAEMLLTKD